jgi:hypothetical protein
MTIRTTFKVDVYDCSVHIICTDKVKASVNRYCKKYDKDDKGINFEPDGFFFRPTEFIHSYYIWLDINNLTNNALSHEKSHLVDAILQDRKIRPHGEQRAYLEGYISEKIAAFFEYQENNLKFK